MAGDIDILHNVAGMNIRKAFPAYTREEYELIMQTNLHGLVEVTQTVGRPDDRKGQRRQDRQYRQPDVGSRSAFLSLYAITKSALGRSHACACCGVGAVTTFR